MAFNPLFDRKASGTFTEGKNENSQSIKFGSAGYVIEDDLNELQSINMNRSALINRSIRTSGIINKIHSNNDNNNSGVIPAVANPNNEIISEIPEGTYINVDGYVIKITKNISILSNDNEELNYLYISFGEFSVTDDRIGNAVKSRRTEVIIEPRANIELGLVKSEEDLLYKIKIPTGNIEENILRQSPTGYVYFLRIKDENGIIYSKIKNNIVEEINSARYINQPTIKFGRVEYEENNFTTKIGWNGRTNFCDSDDETFGNHGILADYLWSNDINDYVKIGDNIHEIVTWKEDEDGNKIIEGTIEHAKTATELDPGFILRTDSDSGIKFNESVETQEPFNGNGQYTLNVNLKLQDGVTPTNGELLIVNDEDPKDENPKDFYNKFTVNDKGVITSGKKATTLSELGIYEFDIDDAKNHDLLRFQTYDADGAESNIDNELDIYETGKWIAVDNIISNCDEKFTYYNNNNDDEFIPTGVEKLSYDGYFYATKVFNAVYNDYAEYFEKGSSDLEPGDVLEINDNGKYVKSSSENSKRVVGVYSDTFGHLLGGTGKSNDEENFVPVGLAGRVNVKVIGDIEPGDLLVSSSVPGVAMKKNAFSFPGTIIGKALEFHKGNSINRIKMLIMNS